jgi:hypothetical protein
MDVEVETRDESGTQLAAATNTSYRTDVFEQYGAQADAEIAKVIADNMPIVDNRSQDRGEARPSPTPSRRLRTKS